MTREEYDRMKWLFEHIAGETNHAVFQKLVRELNDLLEAKHEPIPPERERRKSA